MTLLEQMKADAMRCNAALHTETGSPDPRYSSVKLDRHNKVKSLLNQGLSRREMAERLGVSRPTIDRDLAAIREG